MKISTHQLKQNRISRSASDSAKPRFDASQNRSEKSSFRSPYREPTQMLRLPVSLIPTVRSMLERRKAEVAAGDPDNYF